MYFIPICKSSVVADVPIYPNYIWPGAFVGSVVLAPVNLQYLLIGIFITLSKNYKAVPVPKSEFLLRQKSLFILHTLNV